MEDAEYNYWDKTIKIAMCKIDENMTEAEVSDAIGLNIAIEFNKNPRKNLLPLQKQMNPSPLHTRP